MKFLVFTFLSLLAATAFSQETFTPRFHRPDRVGERFSVDARISPGMSVAGFLPEILTNPTITGDFLAEFEITAAGPQGRTAIKATVKKSDLRNLDGPVHLFAPGDLVEVATIDGALRITLNGQPAPGPAQETLTRLFPVAGETSETRRWAALDPGKKVKIGEAWEARFPGVFEVMFKNPKAGVTTGTGSLDKIIERDGQRVIRMTLSTETKSILNEPEPRLHGTIKHRILGFTDVIEFPLDAASPPYLRARTTSEELHGEGTPNQRGDKPLVTITLSTTTNIIERPLPNQK